MCAAAQSGNTKTAEFCKEKGANLNHRAYGNKTPLGSAEFFKHKEMADDLRRWGATDDAYGRPSSSLDKCSCSNQKKQSKGKKDKEECILM
ncbi:ankyrin repeat domain-containing protein [Candidatus Mesenet endosymbiont of Agriotes lineatus]|uniref:ankyrin repeat domain-containing protein n=1 Tax=Candidatus Mesenet endosymbiont of Agriotes lineatus TaxID=3077948 RepID=UPI0030D28D30